MYNRCLFLIWIVTQISIQTVAAQDFETLTRAYPDSLCSSCDDWNTPSQPFQVHHNTYYVGTHGLSAILITSPEGHILIDGALPDSAPEIIKNIRSLGFDPGEIKLILNSHAHFDHAGGIAALQQISGARVAASPASVAVLESGSVGPDDPQYGIHLDYPAIKNVERFEPGDTLHVGTLAIMSHATAGHTPGGTSWTWQSCKGQSCIGVVYADSQTPVSADGFRYTDSDTYPTAVADFEQGFRTLEQLSCDIMITTHPGASSLWKRLEDGRQGLINPQACKEYAAKARKLLAKRLRTEAEDAAGNE